jgi:hypothetical protein
MRGGDMSGRYVEVMIEELIRKLRGINDVTDRQAIDRTANRLRLLSFDVGLDSGEKEFVEMNKQDVLAQVESIGRMTIEDLEAEKNHAELMEQFERDGQGDRLAYLNRFKVDRIQLYLYNYTLLTRLRNDSDEAWDTVEELYGED